MAYARTTWVDGTTPVDASRLNNIEAGVDDHDDRLDSIETGWVAKPSAHTWSYVSATSIKINVDVTGVLQKGDKIRFKQTAGTYVYFYVIAVSAYTGGYTTLTLTAGDDYTVANQAITSAYYSHQENPFGFPQEFSYTPSCTGFVSTTILHCSFSIFNGLCRFIFEVGGESNSDAISIPAPVTSRRIGAALSTYEGSAGICQDNGAYKTGACRVYIDYSSPSVVNVQSDMANGAWTTSGAKLARATVTYLI